MKNILFGLAPQETINRITNSPAKAGGLATNGNQMNKKAKLSGYLPKRPQLCSNNSFQFET